MHFVWGTQSPEFFQETIPALKKAGFQLGFSHCGSLNTGTDILLDPLRNTVLVYSSWEWRGEWAGTGQTYTIENENETYPLYIDDWRGSSQTNFSSAHIPAPAGSIYLKTSQNYHLGWYLPGKHILVLSDWTHTLEGARLLIKFLQEFPLFKIYDNSPIEVYCNSCFESHEIHPSDLRYEDIVAIDAFKYICLSCAKTISIPTIDHEIDWIPAKLHPNQIEALTKKIQKQIYTFTCVHVPASTIKEILLEGYLTNRGKLITRISKIPVLKKILSLKKNNNILSELGKALATFETVDTNLQYGTLPWEYLGEKIIESSLTCFRSKGENFGHRDFMEAHSTFKAIVWKNLDTAAFGRFILYRPTNNTIYVGSHYSQREELTNLLLTRILCTLSEEEFSFYEKRRPRIPIYLNGDWEVFTLGSNPFKDENKYTCEECGRSGSISSFKDKEGIICCESCNRRPVCIFCLETEVEAEDALCELCANNTFFCSLCEVRQHIDETTPSRVLRSARKLATYTSTSRVTDFLDVEDSCWGCFTRDINRMIKDLPVFYGLGVWFPRNPISVSEMEAFLRECLSCLEEKIAEEEEQDA